MNKDRDNEQADDPKTLVKTSGRVEIEVLARPASSGRLLDDAMEGLREKRELGD